MSVQVFDGDGKCPTCLGTGYKKMAMNRRDTEFCSCDAGRKREAVPPPCKICGGSGDMSKHLHCKPGSLECVGCDGTGEYRRGAVERYRKYKMKGLEVVEKSSD